MKLVIDIPKEFEKHFNEDRFKDSLERIECDIQDDINKEHIIPTVSGLWELELIDMLIEAFKKAESVHSTCTLEGTPIYKMNCDDIWNEAYDKRDGVKQLKLTDIEFVKVNPIGNIKRIMSLKSAARRIREHNRIHYAKERNAPIITEILESCAKLLEDIDAGKMKYVEYGEWKWVDDDPNNIDLICTACGEIQDCGHFKFCPNCGAKMDSDKE